MNDNPVKSVDCVGLYCPQPIFQTREAVESVEIGDVVEILADDPGAEPDLKRFTKRTGHELVLFQKLEDGVLRFLIKRKK
ncbi:sulfurtransferase TusA family protein [Candidatus Thorarchaeota archaeon]|nr:MAG: sulfurtransferase TusA family protein [Candidatus Thorarchaeota archaeon]